MSSCHNLERSIESIAYEFHGDCMKHSYKNNWNCGEIIHGNSIMIMHMLIFTARLWIVSQNNISHHIPYFRSIEKIKSVPLKSLKTFSKIGRNAGNKCLFSKATILGTITLMQAKNKIFFEKQKFLLFFEHIDFYIDLHAHNVGQSETIFF